MKSLRALLLVVAALSARAETITIGYLSYERGNPIGGQNSLVLYNYTGSTLGCGLVEALLPVCTEVTFTGTVQSDWLLSGEPFTFNDPVTAPAGLNLLVRTQDALTSALERAQFTGTIPAGLLLLADGRLMQTDGLVFSVGINEGTEIGTLSVEGVEVPEPSAFVLTGGALLVLLLRKRRIAPVLTMLAACSVLLAQTNVTLSPSVSPSSGQAGITKVNVTASGFPAGAIDASQILVSVAPRAGGAAVSTPASAVVTVIGSTRRVTFLIPAGLAPQTYRIALGGAVVVSTNSVPLTVAAPAALQSVNPNSAIQGGAGTVTIAGVGTHFLNGGTQVSLGAGIAVGAVTVANSTQLQASFTVNPGAAVGARTVTVTSGAEIAALAGAFTVTAAPVVPAITSLTPNSGDRGWVRVPVIIQGSNTHFLQTGFNNSIVDLGPGITVAHAVNFIFGFTYPLGAPTPTRIGVYVSIADDAPLGPRSITVQSGAEIVTLANAFTVTTAPLAISSTSPGFFGAGRSRVPVSVRGTGFTSPTQVSFGPGIAVSNTTFVNSTRIDVTLDIACSAAAGPRTVTVTTPQGTPQATAFEVRYDGLLETGPSSSAILRMGDCIRTSYGFLLMQADGNLALYNGTPEAWTNVVWQAGPRVGGNEAHLQRDGNLVVYQNNGNTPTPLWASNTYDNYGVAGRDHTLRIQSDGPNGQPRLVLFRGRNSAPEEVAWQATQSMGIIGISIIVCNGRSFSPACTTNNGTLLISGRQEVLVATLARLSKILYDAHPWPTAPNPIILGSTLNSLLPLGISYSFQTFGNANTTPDQFAVAFVSGQTLAIVIRGTRGPNQGDEFWDTIGLTCNAPILITFCTSASWKINYHFLPVNTATNFNRKWVHPGWAEQMDDIGGPLDLYAWVRGQVIAHPEKRVIIAGHSQGGALANYAMFRLMGEDPPHRVIKPGDALVTFGAPWVGAHHQDTSDNSFSITFKARLLASGVEHIATEIAGDGVPRSWKSGAERFSLIDVDRTHTTDLWGYTGSLDVLPTGARHDIENFIEQSSLLLIQSRPWYSSTGTACTVGPGCVGQNTARVTAAGKLFLPRLHY